MDFKGLETLRLRDNLVKKAKKHLFQPLSECSGMWKEIGHVGKSDYPMNITETEMQLKKQSYINYIWQFSSACFSFFFFSLVGFLVFVVFFFLFLSSFFPCLAIPQKEGVVGLYFSLVLDRKLILAFIYLENSSIKIFPNSQIILFPFPGVLTISVTPISR